MTANDQVLVDLIISDVEQGVCTREEAIEYLNDRDIFVGRGTDRRLLCAEAKAILTADHSYMASV